jgi:hypothetical protein
VHCHRRPSSDLGSRGWTWHGEIGGRHAFDDPWEPFIVAL